jgi:hypothetical protein
MNLIYQQFNIDIISQALYDGGYYSSELLQMYDLGDQEFLLDVVLEELDYIFYESDL